MQTQFLDYRDENTALQAYVAFDNKTSTPRPVVLIAPAWAGRDKYHCHLAEDMAELGYVGFTLDVYGQGKTGNNKDENAALMQPFMANRSLLQGRLLAAIEAVKTLAVVDKDKLAMVGYCFGGLCVLDVARSGADIKGVVSAHGLLSAPKGLPSKKIKAKVLALHGHRDPMVSPDNVKVFTEELTKGEADWQLHIFGNALHAFTNIEAHDHQLGTVYDPVAARASKHMIKHFLQEIFS